MAKRVNRLLVALFVWALVFAPAIHRLGHARQPCASCAACTHGSNPESGGEDGPGHSPPPAKHDAAHCAICQLAATPMLAAVPMVVFVPDAAPVVIPAHTFQAPAVPAARRLPFACGPPA